MKAKEDENLEKFIAKAMKNVALETTSLDFTAKVMQQVLVAKISTPIVYKPLISKTTWLIIFGSFFAVFIFVMFKNEPQTFEWSDTFIYNKINFNMPTYSFSKITMYSILLGVVFLYVQILFLKYHFDKQFDK